MTAELKNSASTDEQVELRLVVGEDPEVVGQQTVPVNAGETRTVEYLQFRTYPVRNDDTVPVRIETETDVAEMMVTVTGIGPFDAQYAYPNRKQDLSVQPGTMVLFEIDAEMLDQQGTTHWYVDGEYVMTPAGPWPATYFTDVGREFFAHTFDTAGTYLVDAAVIADDGNTASRWEVTVADDGAAPPTVDAARPATSELATDETTTLELDVSSTATELERVVWWMTQSDVILDVSDISGTSDTASIQIDGGCHTCQIEAWVIDEKNAYTAVNPWVFEGFDEAGNDNGGGEGEVTVTILDTNSPVTGGEVLEVTAAIENTGTAEVTQDVDLVVGDDPELVDSRTVTVPAGRTKRFELVFKTYPVAQDDLFPVRVETGDSTDQRTVLAYGTET
ncbi:hypothetical protein [Natrinema gelatinilyticum]|uniref:hypothetical protein n=1 Tax=Natrinema gelatinilyticum TaxID=2961571 RepID=UPI0020C26CC3|nr:hypothetical protein [Natrinema gelatinilyticum]